MTRQEEIRRFTGNYLVGCIHGATIHYDDLSGYDKATVAFQAEELLGELSKLGVVIKVDRKWPSVFDANENVISALEYKKKLEGYAAVEPLLS